MTSVFLTICIPSYNRLDSVKKTVERLFSLKSSFHFKVIVIDNASDINYFEHFSNNEFFKSLLDNQLLEIHRNVTNIGMSANIMRCFEVHDSGWIWIISDDDDLCDDSLICINEALNKLLSSNCSCIYFGTYDGVVGAESLNTLPEFIDLNAKSVNNFNQSIFLSNTLYFLPDIRNFISYGYMNLGTYIPHFLMIVHLLNEGYNVEYRNKKIVNYVKAEIGYSYSMVAGLGVGLPKHSLLNLSKKYYHIYSKLFYPHNDFKVIVDLFYETKSNPPAFDYLSDYYLYYIKNARPFAIYLAVRFFREVAKHEKIFELLLKLLCSLSNRINSDVLEIRKRNSY
ncbi:hypothetical protein A8139_20870 [Marinomonas primoryensis]|uniref:Glycosyltransferase 2-like domain-containing protein n=1 Tax=Marinomonas primoryensis TaxID=178399 RepID=A0A2Z4PVA9_9GAMM|nr:glycosyltransferase [Marinomonas primoryensis]AWY01059.1 hypothetical protein A8139_14525 [Marinomonas primoryensis]AWY02114.1 hypothetical protein A8139_20870 [Marinomonas primoryensis]